MGEPERGVLGQATQFSEAQIRAMEPEVLKHVIISALEAHRSRHRDVYGQWPKQVLTIVLMETIYPQKED